MAGSRSKSSRSDSAANLGFEAKLWLAADKLRNNMDAAQIRRLSDLHPVLLTTMSVNRSILAKANLLWPSHGLQFAPGERARLRI